jgi:hypothetical protein
VEKADKPCYSVFISVYPSWNSSLSNTKHILKQNLHLYPSAELSDVCALWGSAVIPAYCPGTSHTSSWNLYQARRGHTETANIQNINSSTYSISQLSISSTPTFE